MGYFSPQAEFLQAVNEGAGYSCGVCIAIHRDSPKTHHPSAFLAVHLPLTLGHKTSLGVKNKNKPEPPDPATATLLLQGRGGYFCCGH